MRALRLGGAYDLLAPDVRGRASGPLVRALIIVVVGTLAAYFLAPRSFPRSTSVLAPLPVFASLLAFRGLAARAVARSALLQRRVLFVGVDDTTRSLARVLGPRERPVPYVPVGFVTDDAGVGVVEGLPVLGGFARLAEHVRTAGAQEVVLGTRAGLRAEVQGGLIECARDGVAIEPASRLHEDITARVLRTGAHPAGQRP